MLKAGDLARWEDHHRGGQKRDNPTRLGDITCMPTLYVFWAKPRLYYIKFGCDGV